MVKRPCSTLCLVSCNNQRVFDGTDVTTLSTSERNIAQVFQFSVIYGTMTVEQNLAFLLVCRNSEKSMIDAKVLNVCEN